MSLIRSVCSDDLLIYRKGLKRLRVSFTLQIGAFYFKSKKCRLFRHFILYQCGNVRGSEECTIRIVLQKVLYIKERDSVIIKLSVDKKKTVFAPL